MPDDETSGEWLDRILAAAAGHDAKTVLRCPSPDCDSRTFAVTVLGTVGPRDDLGVVCSSCGTAAAKVKLDDASAPVHDQIADAKGSGHDA
jgi:hypothetical protein